MKQVRSPRKSADKAKSKIQYVVKRVKIKRVKITYFSNSEHTESEKNIRNSFSSFPFNGDGWEVGLKSSENKNDINNCWTTQIFSS